MRRLIRALLSRFFPTHFLSLATLLITVTVFAAGCQQSNVAP